MHISLLPKPRAARRPVRPSRVRTLLTVSVAGAATMLLGNAVTSVIPQGGLVVPDSEMIAHLEQPVVLPTVQVIAPR